jgi:integral membrane protein (TIGR01906 family)
MSSQKNKILTLFVIVFLPFFLLERIFLSSPTVKILRWFIIALLPILITITAVGFLATDQYLTFEYGKVRFPPDLYGFTPEQRFELASTNIHYVRAHLPDDTLAGQKLDGKAVYNTREISHMADVQSVFQGILRVWQLAFVLLVILGFVFWKMGERMALAASLQAGGLLTSGIILTIALLAIFAWQTWFDLFHRFLFVPGSWLFSYSDTLIRLFPVKFWFDATLTISLLSFVGGLLLALIGRQWRIAIEKPSRKQSWSSMFEY